MFDAGFLLAGGLQQPFVSSVERENTVILKSCSTGKHTDLVLNKPILPLFVASKKVQSNLDLRTQLVKNGCTYCE
jgi:hypothetical protein